MRTDAQRFQELWDRKFNTAEIARACQTTEPYVCRSLHQRWRLKRGGRALPEMTRFQRQIYDRLRRKGVSRLDALTEAMIDRAGAPT